MTRCCFLCAVIGIVLSISACSGSKGITNPGDGNVGGVEGSQGLLSAIARGIDWDSSNDYGIGVMGYDERRVDVTDVRMYKSSFTYSGDIHRHSGSPSEVDQSMVVYAWQEKDGSDWLVKWRVVFYDDSDGDVTWADVQTVPGYGEYPAVTAYFDPLSDKITVDIVFQEVDSGYYKIFHCRYRQDTSEDYDNFSLDPGLHPGLFQEPVEVSGGDYTNWHPDVVWWGDNSAGESKLFCVFEEHLDSDGGCGAVRIRWCYYDEGDTEWRGHTFIDVADDYDVSHYPRLDVGHDDDINGGDYVCLVTWHVRDQISSTWQDPEDIDIWTNWWDAGDMTPDTTNCVPIIYTDEELNWDMYPHVDFDLPRNDVHLAHFVWSKFEEDWYDPGVMYWNTDMWSGIYPAPELFATYTHDEALATIAVCPDVAIGLDYDKAYAAYIDEDSSSHFWIGVEEIDYSTTDDPDFSSVSVAISEGRTSNPSTPIYGPVPAARHEDQVHVGCADKGPDGTDDWDIMEDGEYY